MQLANDGLHLLDLTTSVYITIRQNTVADSLSHIPWENVTFYSQVDYNLVKAVVHKGEVNSIGSIEPEFIFDDPNIYIKKIGQ